MMRLKSRRKSPQLPRQLKIPKVPKTFINNSDVKQVLCDITSGFRYEEKQAIYFYCALDITADEVAKVTQLSHTHVLSVLGLYSERLESMLCFFKSFMPYNANDLLSASEILFLEGVDNNGFYEFLK